MLGGHLSRRHPGKSVDYNKKLEVRKRREPERDALKRAKTIYFEKTGLDPKFNAGEVKKIKESIWQNQQKMV